MTVSSLASLRDRLTDKKYLVNWVVIAGIAGMILIAISEWLPISVQPTTTTKQQDRVEAAADEYEQNLEKRLENLIQSVEGAGETRVMVTLAASEFTVYATDNETRNDGSIRQEHLLLDGDSDPPALVETTRMPEIQGVAVLCSGADNLDVQARITQIVEVLTGIGSNRITVERMAQQD